MKARLSQAATVIGGALFMGQAHSLQGDHYICHNAGEKREVEVVYLAETQVPCEVQYTKNGITETLWLAQNQVGYCEDKAAAFVEQLRGWHFTCEALANENDQN